jgi:hypothetical protein
MLNRFRILTATLATVCVLCSWLLYELTTGGTLPVTSLRSVEFYGRVLDQDKNPVEGAIVKYNIGGLAYAAGTGSDSTVTDASGLFTTEGGYGSSLHISNIGKAGFEFKRADGRSTGNAYQFEDHKRFPDSILWSDYTATNPYAYTVWRIDQSVKITSGERKYYFTTDGAYFARDGRRYPINLKNRVSRRAGQSIDAHLNASFERTDATWKLILSAKGGGFVSIPAGVLYTNEAPVSGYQETIEISGVSGVPRSDIHQKKYYLKTESGAYAALDIEIRPYYGEDAYLGVRYALNEQGGTSLSGLTR